MPKIKLPIQPNTCAWPCACNHAGEMEASALSPADLEEIPHSEECAWQQHENKPRADVSHEKARKRRLTRAGNFHYLGGRERGMAARSWRLSLVFQVKSTWHPLNRPQFPSPLHAGRGCCFPDARAGEDPLRTPSNPGTAPYNLCMHPQEPCIPNWLCESASPILPQHHALSSWRESGSSPFGRREARRSHVHLFAFSSASIYGNKICSSFCICMIISRANFGEESPDICNFGVTLSVLCCYLVQQRLNPSDCLTNVPMVPLADMPLSDRQAVPTPSLLRRDLRVCCFHADGSKSLQPEHLHAGTLHAVTFRHHSSSQARHLREFAWPLDSKAQYPSLWFRSFKFMTASATAQSVEGMTAKRQ